MIIFIISAFLTHLCTVLIATVSFLLSFYFTFNTKTNEMANTNYKSGNSTFLEDQSGSYLGPAEVFSSLALFNQLAVPLFMFPAILPVAISALVSTKRIAKYLSKIECKNLLPEDEENVSRIKQEWYCYVTGLSSHELNYKKAMYLMSYQEFYN